MRKVRHSIALVLALAVVAMGCSGGSPTAPVADNSLEAVTEAKKCPSPPCGGGGSGKDQGAFTVTFSGGVVATGSTVSSESSKVVIDNYILEVAEYLAELEAIDPVEYADYEACFENAPQDHTGDLTVEASRKNSNELTIKMTEFSGKRTDGVTPLDYKLEMTASISNGGTWPITNIGTSVEATMTGWKVTGYRKSVSCQGEGDFSNGPTWVTVTRTP